MPIRITESEYRAELESICESIVTAYPVGADYQECIHEIVDGHQWSIWTAYHLAIYAVSESTDAWKDVYSDLSSFDSLEDVHQAVAYFAMSADIHDAFQGYHEDKIAEVFALGVVVDGDENETDDLTVENEYGDLYRFADKETADIARRLIELGGH